MILRNKINRRNAARRPVVPVLLMLCCALLAGCFSMHDPDEPQARTVELFFATTRAPEGNGECGRERGDLAFGIADVAIPPNHVIGRNEQPSMFRFEWSEDERKHIAFRGTTALPADTFVQQLNAAIEQSPQRRLMVFVHGYNVDFPE